MRGWLGLPRVVSLTVGADGDFGRAAADFAQFALDGGFDRHKVDQVSGIYQKNQAEIGQLLGLAQFWTFDLPRGLVNSDATIHSDSSVVLGS